MAKLKFKKGYSDVGVFPLLSHVLKEGGLIVDDEDFELNPATSLTGEEKVKILQDGKTLLTTTQDIAALAGGGGGIAIGDAITDADAGSILYVDGSGNLTQGTGFTRTSTGVTNILSTFGTDTFGYQIGDNLLGYDITGSANTLTNVAGDSAFNGIYRDNVKGDLYSKNEIVLSDGSMVSEIIDMGTFANTIHAYNGSSFLSGTSVIASDAININNVS